MSVPIYRSLLVRMGLAMGLITGIALLGMISSVWIARATHGEAAAVNVAGSLRMLSYRIATAFDQTGDFQAVNALANEFVNRLHGPTLVYLRNDGSEGALEGAYAKVDREFAQRIRPLIARAADPAQFTQVRREYLGQVDAFVVNIDQLVKLLEEDAEAKINLLGFTQGISLLLTVVVIVVSLYLTQTDLINPLRDLLDAAERAGGGDLTVRVAHTGEDELGHLGQTFNAMAGDLSKVYASLEQRVEEKTRELTRSNRSLELLYTTMQRLTEAPLSESTYRDLLGRVEEVLDVGPSTLCLLEPGASKALRLAHTGMTPPMCADEDCASCFQHEFAGLIQGPNHDPRRVFSIPVYDRDRRYGVLLVDLGTHGELQLWQNQLLQTIAQHIGIAIGTRQQETQRRRLALLEERSVIARELHDSLAQSLSYLKIQVARLGKRLESSPDPAAQEVLDELREGIGAAYRQLRELLTTFRLQMNGAGLGPALAQTIEEFNQRGEVAISLENSLRGCPLSVNEEIHLLQIVREALANVLRHAHARRASVQLSCSEDATICLTVADDGIGIPEAAARTHHYGLAILRERAESLGGDLRIARRPSGGTEVYLRFRPQGGTRNHA